MVFILMEGKNMISEKRKNKIIKQADIKNKKDFAYIILYRYLSKDADEFLMNYMAKKGYDIFEINFNHIIFKKGWEIK